MFLVLDNFASLKIHQPSQHVYAVGRRLLKPHHIRMSTWSDEPRGKQPFCAKYLPYHGWGVKHILEAYDNAFPGQDDYIFDGLCSQAVSTTPSRRGLNQHNA